MTDYAKSLGDLKVVEERLNMLNNDNVKDLTMYVEKLRKRYCLNKQIPFFDPMDGGVFAKCLFVLEAPGPNAVKSGFISRNNPDETAKNMFDLLQELKIPRSETILWNIVPWYIGRGEKIRPANNNDIEEGYKCLEELIVLIKRIKLIVLVGLKAQRIEKLLINNYRKLKIIKCYHPSPLYINNKKDNRGILSKQLFEIKDYI